MVYARKIWENIYYYLFNRSVLDADPQVVDLNKQTPYFYKLGLAMLQFYHPEDAELSRVLLRTFSSRLQLVMDLSRHKLASHRTNDQFKRLNHTELKLYKIGKENLQQYEEWVRGESRKLNTSKLVSKYRKRKLYD